MSADYLYAQRETEIFDALNASAPDKTINPQIFWHAASAQAIVEHASDDRLSAIPFESRYRLIHRIQEGIKARHPVDKDNPFKPIELDAVRDEVSAIKRVSRTLRLSDDYTDFILHITRQAALELVESRENVKRLMQWDTNGDALNLELSKELHELIMQKFKCGLGSFEGSQPFADAVKSGFLEMVDWAPNRREDGTISGITQGQASRIKSNHVLKETLIELNVNPAAAFKKSASRTGNVVGHETAHGCENDFASMFDHFRHYVPEIFRKDAEMLAAMKREGGYITSRLNKAYAGQAVELVAFAAGDVVEEVIEESFSQNTVEVPTDHQKAMTAKVMLPRSVRNRIYYYN